MNAVIMQRTTFMSRGLINAQQKFRRAYERMAAAKNALGKWAAMLLPRLPEFQTGEAG
ncbi:hypothetical protein AALB53_03910 [Lachnospiraceae bacterium 47-T17]